jgi:hypothetical protein
MTEAPQLGGVDRQRLELVTRTAANYQGLGVSIGGLLAVLYGVANLRSHQFSTVRLLPMFLVVLFGAFVIPSLFARVYYRRKFGYVKPVSANPSWKAVWLSTGAFALIIFLMFKVSDYTYSHRSAFGFEPLSFFLGIVFLTIALSGMRKPHYYEPWTLLINSFALLAIALLPMFHVQTKEQVSNGWLWVVLGTGSIIDGLGTHRVLTRNLTPTELRQGDA